MAIAVFNATIFKARYAEFAAVDNAFLGTCFDEAGEYLSNTDTSPVQDITRRTRLLNMLTAHIACLSGALSVNVSALPVGRTSQAAEGSVSASFEYMQPGTQAWFVQTQYGAAFYQATSSLRGFRYAVSRTMRCYG
jgi:Protein of unknown function (DUF4054)